jgi:GNAT superfamily N-acetyltransferase
VNEISIRKATVEDAAVIHNLLTELEKTLGATSKIKRTVADLETFGFSGQPCFDALIAWEGARAVGLAVFFKEFSTWRGAPGVYVQDLYVSESLRGSGLGAKLMNAVFEHARDWGVRYCKLSVHAGNDAAMAFYERLGFEEAHDDHVFVLDGL